GVVADQRTNPGKAADVHRLRADVANLVAGRNGCGGIRGHGAVLSQSRRKAVKAPRTSHPPVTRPRCSRIPRALTRDVTCAGAAESCVARHSWAARRAKHATVS